jgi:hypothetical protein
MLPYPMDTNQLDYQHVAGDKDFVHSRGDSFLILCFYHNDYLLLFSMYSPKKRGV